MQYHKIIFKVLFFIILGYLVGLLIKLINPFYSSQNAPFICAIGAVSFFTIKTFTKTSSLKAK